METNKQRLRVVSFNVNGVLNPQKRTKIITKLKKEKTHIALLQETHLNETEHLKLKQRGFKWIFSSSYKYGHRRGVAILISNQVNYEHLSEKKDKEGRFICIKGKINGTQVTIFNIYAPPGSQWSFFKQILNMISTESEGILIWGGDMNIRLSKLDYSGKSIISQNQVRKKINTILKEIGIIDIWRNINPNTRDYSHFSAPHSTYSRIDYFFTFLKDRHRVTSCDIGTIDISDHAPIIMTININHNKRNTLWKLNSSILNNPFVKENIKSEIETYFEENNNGEVTPIILWDAFKAVLRGKMIARTALLKKISQGRIDSLQIKLKKAQALHKRTNDPGEKQIIKKLQKELDSLLSEEIQRKLLFLRQNYYEAGNKSTRLLAYKLRKQQTESTVYKIRNPETNNIHHKLEEIQKKFRNILQNPIHTTNNAE